VSRWLSDAALAHLRGLGEVPDLAGTKYTLVRQLGAGGMGIVYLAEDRELGRHVALKVLRREHADPETAARLVREARILAGLEHPGIVPVHEIGTLPDGRSYYVMKHVEGERLDEVVRRGLSRAQSLTLFERICDTVAFAHAHGVVHRDLKPENVMVGPFGATLVLDWGVAKRMGEGAAPHPTAASAPAAGALTAGALTLDGAVIGTPAYMAPEQRAGATVDARADVYALGALLHFLLAGRPAPGPGVAPPDVPRALASICRRATAADPAARYDDVASLAADVGRFQAGERVEAHREAWFERAARLAVRFRTPILLVVAYLVVRLVLLAFSRS
jgi:serine/threonine protein kinase